MISVLDSSVLIASLDTSEPSHARSNALFSQNDLFTHTHALAETFSTLTGGRLRYRISPADATRLIRESILPFVSTISVNSSELFSAMDECERRGVRGGAFYDLMHLFAAKKVNAVRLYTLNLSDFRSFWRPGDPEIVYP